MVIARMGEKNTTSFDLNWSFYRFGLQTDGSTKQEPAEIESVTYNDQNWQKVNLPHDYAISGPFRIDLSGNTGKLPWQGIGWYRKKFSVPATDKNKRTFIDFDGAMANAKIWVNGQYIGTWPYGYTSFRMDITPALKYGATNTIAVRVDTENMDSRWYPGAGIYRHVWLVKTENIHVAQWGTYITTPKIDTKLANIDMELTIANETQAATKAIIKTSIFHLKNDDSPSATALTKVENQVFLANNKETKVKVNAQLNNPILWSIENPHRYVSKTEIWVNGKITDTYFTPFGVRTIAFSVKNGFQLNGKRVEIKGTCNHHDLGAIGAAINTKALQRQLVMLKEMGCNSLRTSHNPPAPELLALADKMGFLVWDEAFDTWKKGKKRKDYNILFDEWHEKDLTALVHRDRNHPSVFIWSIGNEVIDQRNVAMTKELADIMRREDPTRPISNGYNDPDGSRGVGSPMSLDIMGVNYFFSQQPKWDADPRYANMPTIGSETSSAISSRGVYFFDKNPFQYWQVSSFDNAFPGWGSSPDTQFAINAKFPHLLGEYVWTGFDYLGEPTPYNSDETNLLNFRNDPSKKAELAKLLEEMTKKNPPSRSSYFGIIDLAGFKKDRFYLYQAHWRPELAMAHILPHWNWPNRIDSITPVHVYTSGDEAELFLNGKSLGKKAKVAGKDFRLVWDQVKYQPGELKVIAYKNGKQWAQDVVKTTSEAATLKLKSDVTKIKNNGDDLCFITASITDKTGLMVPTANNSITFSIEGPGELVATDNGDATSFESFQSPNRKAFNGLALLIIKAKKGRQGPIKITAQSASLQKATIMVTTGM